LWRWLGGNPAESDADRDWLHQVAVGLDEALATFFALFTTHFTSEDATRRWEETQEVFRTDLKRVFSHLE
jgi:hypothetical protein